MTSIPPIADSIRAVIAGSHAARVVASSTTLFETAGKRLLTESARTALRGAVERGASRAIAAVAGPLFEPVASLGARPAAFLGAGAHSAGDAAAIARSAATGLGKHAARAAAKEVLKGAGRAAGIGFVVDGAVASVEAVLAVRSGSADMKTAAKHVAKEASSGAVATGAGVLLGAGLVALTGGLATPAVFVVGAIGAIGTKRWLRRALG